MTQQSGLLESREENILHNYCYILKSDSKNFHKQKLAFPILIQLTYTNIYSFAFRHAEVMKKIIETVAEGGGELGVHMYPYLSVYVTRGKVLLGFFSPFLRNLAPHMWKS